MKRSNLSSDSIPATVQALQSGRGQGGRSSVMGRRTLLRAAGVAMGLPLLEAMTPAAKSAFADAKGAPSATRMAACFVPNGVIVPDWTPEGEGTDWKLSKTLQPLAPLKNKLNVISGLALDAGRAKRDGAGDHARSAATYLTATRALKTSSNIRLGVSVDQVAAQQLRGQTKLSSIELGLLESRNAGSCDSGYSCAYSSNISWRNESQPMAKEVIPRMAFERMFGSRDGAARRESNAVRSSILDVVRSDAQRLTKYLGASDRRKLDEYFNSVRELERRIEMTEREDAAAMPAIDIPHGRVNQFVDHARLMADLMVLGFQTDTTRVATLMYDNAGGNRTYPEVDVREAHHGLSHHRNDPRKVGALSRVDKHLMTQFAYLLKKMDSVQEVGGTLLDNSMILYGSGLSDGNRHSHEDLPVVLAGSAGGRFVNGQHIRLTEETPMANLFLSMLDAMGTPVEEFGDSTGLLSELRA